MIVKIESYSADKAKEVVDLYHQSVHAIDPTVYTLNQQEAWAPTPPNYDDWFHRLKQKKPYLAIIRGDVVGFIELDLDGYVDCMYTHPDFQRVGVASTLYAYILNKAKERNITRLFVEASYIAKPFFEKKGFNIVKKNKIFRRNVCLVNFSMEKMI